MSTANSEALFPPPQRAAQIAAEYEDQCRTLCYGPFPTWPEIQARFDQLRDVL